MLFDHKSRVHSSYSCLVSRPLVKKTVVIVGVSLWGSLQCQFTVTFSTVPWLTVLPLPLCSCEDGESKTQFEVTGTYFVLYLDTQNLHFIWKKCIVAWLEAWSRLSLNPVYSIISHREQWDKCQVQKPSRGRHLAGVHRILGQCSNRWRLTLPSYSLPPSFTLTSFTFHMGSCHLFGKYSVSKALLPSALPSEGI